MTLTDSDKLSKLRYIYLLPLGILLISGILKIVSPEIMIKELSSFNLDEPDLFIFTIGLIEILGCTLFLIPKTREIGFILLTAFIGGIIAVEAIKSESMPYFPMILQTTFWAGYYFEKAVNRVALSKLLIPNK